MCNFKCPDCGKPIISSPGGFRTECKHFPRGVKPSYTPGETYSKPRQHDDIHKNSMSEFEHYGDKQ